MVVVGFGGGDEPQRQIRARGAEAGRRPPRANDVRRADAMPARGALAHADAEVPALLQQVDATGVLEAEGEQQLRAVAAQVLPPAKGRAFFTNYDRSTWS